MAVFLLKENWPGSLAEYLSIMPKNMRQTAEKIDIKLFMIFSIKHLEKEL